MAEQFLNRSRRRMTRAQPHIVQIEIVVFFSPLNRPDVGVVKTEDS